MKNIGYTMWYFFIQGLSYGLALGAWSTTIMFPIIGTVFGLAWGAGIGAVCGFVCGALAAWIQAYTFHPDMDLALYSHRLSIGLGTLVAIMAPILLIATSNGILWGGYESDSPEFLAPSLMAVIFWGGLSAAYVAYGYPAWLARLTIERPIRYGFDASCGPIMKAILQKDVCAITLIVGGILGAGMRGSDFLRFEPMHTTIINEGIRGAVVGMIGAALIVIMLTFGVAALIMFLSRLMSPEDISFHRQRLLLTGSAAILTGVVCFWPIVALGGLNWAWIFPAVATLLMGFYVYRALPSLYGTDKAKRKEKDKTASAA